MKVKKNMIPLKPFLIGPNLTNITEIKQRMAILTAKMRRIKVKKMWNLNSQRKIKYEGDIERIEANHAHRGKIDVYA